MWRQERSNHAIITETEQVLEVSGACGITVMEIIILINGVQCL